MKPSEFFIKNALNNIKKNIFRSSFALKYSHNGEKDQTF